MTNNMTDTQFKAMVKMCLTMAEHCKDAKDFKKILSFPDNGFGMAFVVMLSRLVDGINDMEKICQTLRDIMMLEGGIQ